MTNWRPIKSAPRDRRILLYGQMRPCELLHSNGPEVFSGYWDDIDSAWCCSGSTYHGPFYTPTHWMELPDPPRPSKAEQKR